MKQNNNENISESLHRVIRQDYWIDFLGGILPGTLLVVAYIFIFSPVLYLSDNFIKTTKPSENLIYSFLNATKDTPNIFWLGVSVVFFFVIYIIGHIFYRKDPQKPNRKSLRRLIQKEAKRKRINFKKYMHYIRNKNRAKSSLKFEDFKKLIQKEYACTSEDDCEFPYPYFAMYLENRGLGYLKKYVPWEHDILIRTKNFINILKTRIRFYYPDNCGIIIRNEAHVRLACSSWYVGRAISIGVLVAIIFLLFSIAMPLFLVDLSTWFKLLNYYKSSLIITICFIISIAILGELMRRHIELFLHYQRQREVVHVLETAWTAFKNLPNTKDIMCPPYCDKKSTRNKGTTKIRA